MFAIQSNDSEYYIAAVLDDDGDVIDYTYNWETAQNIALSEGRKIIALRDDGGMTKDDIQKLCDAERERYRDCFGIED